MASNHDCSNPNDFSDMAFMIFSLFSSKNLIINKLTELEILKPVVGCCQGTLRGCKPGVHPSMTARILLILEILCFYMIFSFFQKN